jgi:hypothetical protein
VVRSFDNGMLFNIGGPWKPGLMALFADTACVTTSRHTVAVFTYPYMAEKSTLAGKLYYLREAGYDFESTRISCGVRFRFWCRDFLHFCNFKAVLVY